MSNQALYEKLGQTTELISTKLAELIRLSSIEDSQDDDKNDHDMLQSNDNNQGNSEISTATTSVLMVNNQSIQLIKGVQDLLILTRSIREKWLLNQIPEETNSEPQIDVDELKDLLNACTKEIIGTNDI